MPVGNPFLQFSLCGFGKCFTKPLDSIGTLCFKSFPDKLDVAQYFPSVKSAGSTPTVVQIAEPFQCLAWKGFPKRNEIEQLGGVR